VSTLRLGAALAALLCCGPVAAHSFGRIYNLPVPIWLYLYGAAAALAASFLVIGWFVGAGQVPQGGARRHFAAGGWTPALTALRILSLLLLLLCIATGLWGTRNPYGNFNMTFFWVVFVLGFAYLSALVGDLYPQVNPLQALGDGVTRLWRGFSAGRLRYPAALGHWPALALYMAFIWIELFGGTTPRGLALLLIGYSLLNLFMVWLIGARDWFRYGEFFAVFFHLVSRMAPLRYDAEHGRIELRWPFAGLLEERAQSLSLLLFILFMLSSTAFDGLRETVPWVKLFWIEVYGLIKPLLSDDPREGYKVLGPIYLGWQTFWLLASPFIYLGIYLVFVWLAKVMALSPLPLRELALRFGYSLLPIALVYNVTHYFTLVMTQGVKVLPLLSDPFGLGWDLFGTARWFRAPIIPDAGWVWHTQVALIVLGHIVSVYLAHIEALRVFPGRRAALLSQLPMLGLMMVFTTAGLWILAQPIQGGM
jgi:hypothetical protein